MTTQFAKVGDAHVAYRVFGDGPTDILLTLGEYIPVDALDEEPRYARSLRRLSSSGRVIAFNRRGVGLSDPPDGPVTTDQEVIDALAVLDHAGSSQAVVFGSNIGGHAALLFAAEFPERTAALLLVNTLSRLLWAPDYTIGLPENFFSSAAAQTTATDSNEPGEFDFLSEFAPSVANDVRFRKWWDSAGHRAASPGRAQELWRLVLESDERHVLGDITAPTLVVQRSSVMNRELARYMADHIPGARYVELPGNDLFWWLGDTDAILDEVETFLSGVLGSDRRGRRALASVLFVDVVTSTELAARLGDRRWREIVETYHELTRRQVGRCGGDHIGTEGDGVLATFAMPADAIACARAINEAVGALDLKVRAGVHTGEIEILGGDVAGIGVHIAARVKELAGPGEILVSRTVADLVTGSGIRFEEHGEYELRGVPGRWALFSVEGLT